jgi:hypothetical protein
VSAVLAGLLTHVDAFGKRPAYGYLLAAALEYERSRGDSGHALDAGALGHAEAEGLDTGKVVIDRDDLQMLTGTDAVKGAGLREVVLGGATVVSGHRPYSLYRRLSTC